MAHVKDIRRLIAQYPDYRCFCSMQNGSNVRVTIVKGATARNMDHGERIYQKVFERPWRVAGEDLEDIETMMMRIGVKTGHHIINI